MDPAVENKPDLNAMVGRVFEGRFRATRFIDKGGMGAVFEGVDIESDHPVAIKVLTVSTDDQLFRRRFFNEAAMSTTLKHPNVVDIYHYGAEEDGTCYMVMELLEGSPLNRYLRTHGALSPNHALRIAADVCGVLEQAHAQGFIHRDLKPSNLFVTGEDDQGPIIKVLDFGLAKRTQRDTNLTVPGTMLGSPKYMSPEQLHGGTLGPETDIYNIGLLLFRMVTNRDTFVGETMQAILIAQATKKPQHLAEVKAELADQRELDWIIQTCLAKHPTDRFSDVTLLTESIAIARNVLRGEQPSVEMTLHNGQLQIASLERSAVDVRLLVVGAVVGVGLLSAGALLLGVVTALLLLG